MRRDSHRRDHGFDDIHYYCYGFVVIVVVFIELILSIPSYSVMGIMVLPNLVKNRLGRVIGLDLSTVAIVLVIVVAR